MRTPQNGGHGLGVTASRHGAPVTTAGELKSWLIGQLNCWVGNHHLRDYQGVVGNFLMDLALPITIYLLDYFLPQLNPTERCIDTLDIMAAPVHYGPQLMTFTFMREDPDFAYYAFTNTGGNVMVMTPRYADQRNNYVDYVQYYDGKPLEVGRMIAILFEQMEPRANYAVVGLITEMKGRNRPDRSKRQTRLRRPLRNLRVKSSSTSAMHTRTKWHCSEAWPWNFLLQGLVHLFCVSTQEFKCMN